MSAVGTVRSRDSSPMPSSPSGTHNAKKPRLEYGLLAEDEIPAALQESSAAPDKEKAFRKPKKFKAPPPPEPGSADDVSWRDIVQLLGQDVVDAASASKTDYKSPVVFGDEFELVVDMLSSNGEALARLPAPHPPWAVKIPFALPQETVRVKIVKHTRMASHADLLEIVKPNDELRDMSRVRCQYFGKCAGCQYQMLSYDKQLEFKSTVVEKAYKNYSGLDASDVAPVLPTMASPLQYGYRTKITPHFDAPPENRMRKGKHVAKKAKDATWELKIGFEERGKPNTLDIEECPIATQCLNDALGPAREKVKSTIHTYKRAATLLLRDSLESFAPDPVAQPETHVCISDHKAVVRERVGAHIFEFPAGSFFQNNNAILPTLVSYVKSAIEDMSTPDTRPTHLVDAYCGSGLFSITLASAFEKVVGVEIDEQAIKAARANAALNGLPADRCAFTAGKAEAIFASVLGVFPAERTAVVIDPPRKGCDERFLKQLLEFRPATLVYVSCNVHTQARDVGLIVGRTKGDEEGRRYRMESLRGFDLFPQTAHVESVAVLRLV
ncbi:S-adenosyl-L-methionine-dependent methyltransferase [Exidia glandulosa HHB12029]|uniref:S-adenosyl-L-methionine-dependent methyltransferase n=1 Tax=Exidia glandulosa HHB12029 TaxID=1314781 RepID=A0A165BRH1_EXIGL|nr:S-adenosyl-L-methionine-dependent methyltransferase [Exidia glandulosa HHB12029]